jgi:outer membrane protein TolC
MKFLITLFFIITLSVFLTAEKFSLEECLEKALKANPELWEARYEIKKQKAKLGIEYSTNWPFLELSGGYSREKDKPEGFLSEISLSQLFRFGQEPDSQYYQRRALRKAIFDYREIERRVIKKVRQAFFELLLLDEEQRERAKFLSENKQKYERACAKHKIGQVLVLDVLYAELQVLKEEYRLAEITRLINERKKALLQLLGQDLKEPLEIEGQVDFSEFELEKCVAKAFKNSFELEELRLEVKDHKRRKRETLWAFWPNISLLGSYSKGDIIYSFSISQMKSKSTWETQAKVKRRLLGRSATNEEETWKIGANLSLPLFTGFKRYNEYLKEVFELRKLELALSEKQKEIELKVTAAYNNYLSMREKYILASKDLEIKRKTLYIYENLKEIGEAGYDELMRAQDGYTQAQEKFFKSKQDCMKAQEELLEVIGH